MSSWKRAGDGDIYPQEGYVLVTKHVEWVARKSNKVHNSINEENSKSTRHMAQLV